MPLNQMTRLFTLIRLTVNFCGILLDQECVNKTMTVIHVSILCQEVIHGTGHAQELVRSILLTLANLLLNLKRSLIQITVPWLGSKKRKSLCQSMKKLPEYSGKKGIHLHPRIPISLLSHRHKMFQIPFLAKLQN